PTRYHATHNGPDRTHHQGALEPRRSRVTPANPHGVQDRPRHRASHGPKPRPKPRTPDAISIRKPQPHTAYRAKPSTTQPHPLPAAVRDRILPTQHIAQKAAGHRAGIRTKESTGHTRPNAPASVLRAKRRSHKPDQEKWDYPAIPHASEPRNQWRITFQG